MDKVTFIDVIDFLTQEKQTHAIIEHEDGSQTSMLKSFYDEQLEHLTEIVPGE